MTIDKMAYEGDIVSRLRNWRGLHLAHGGTLFSEAAAEIACLRGDAEVARLRLEAAQAEPCPYVTGKTTRYCTLTPFTITDEEREAVAGAIDVLEQEDQWHAVGEARIKTLRGLLERLPHV